MSSVHPPSRARLASSLPSNFDHLDRPTDFLSRPAAAGQTARQTMAFLRPLSRSGIPALASSSSSLAASSSSSSSLLASSARASCSTGPTLKRFVRRGLPAFPSTVIPPRVRAPVYDPARVAAEKAGPDVPPPTWSPLSRRCGLLAVKKGMTQVWDANGVSVPVTVLQVGLSCWMFLALWGVAAGTTRG